MSHSRRRKQAPPPRRHSGERRRGRCDACGQRLGAEVWCSVKRRGPWVICTQCAEQEREADAR